MTIINEITIVMSCYNSFEIIKKNVLKLNKIKTIVVDNSRDYKLKKLLTDYPNIQYFDMQYNAGFAKANNYGAKKVKTKYLFICNPDITFEIENLCNLANKFNIYKNLGIAGPSLYDEFSNRERNSSINKIKTITKRNPLEKKIMSQIQECYPNCDFCADYIIGCSMMFRTNFFNNELKGFDEDFFIFYEDNNICDKSYILKKTVMEFPDIKMTHQKNTSGNYNFFLKTKMAYHHKLSEYIYFKKNIKKSSLYSILILNFFDYLQRFIKNIFFLKFNKSFKNILRVYSIVYFLIFK